MNHWRAAAAAPPNTKWTVNTVLEKISYTGDSLSLSHTSLFSSFSSFSLPSGLPVFFLFLASRHCFVFFFFLFFIRSDLCQDLFPVFPPLLKSIVFHLCWMNLHKTRNWERLTLLNCFVIVSKCRKPRNMWCESVWLWTPNPRIASTYLFHCLYMLCYFSLLSFINSLQNIIYYYNNQYIINNIYICFFFLRNIYWYTYVFNCCLFIFFFLCIYIWMIVSFVSLLFSNL